MPLKTRIRPGILDDQLFCAPDGDVADGARSRSILHCQSTAARGFEPLAVVIDEGKRGSGGIEQVLCRANDPVETFLGFGVEYAQRVEGLLALSFVGRIETARRVAPRVQDVRDSRGDERRPLLVGVRTPVTIDIPRIRGRERHVGHSGVVRRDDPGVFVEPCGLAVGEPLHEAREIADRVHPRDRHEEYPQARRRETFDAIEQQPQITAPLVWRQLRQRFEDSDRHHDCIETFEICSAQHVEAPRGRQLHIGDDIDVCRPACAKRELPCQMAGQCQTVGEDAETG